MFVNGDLRGKFIMDRNLGVRDTNYWADKGIGNIHYAFGRKDPFVKRSATNGVVASYVGCTDEQWSYDIIYGPVPISTSINKPWIYYRSDNGANNWSEAVDSETYVWNDFEQDVANNGKSIFDPSPKGWKIPIHGTWEGFDTKMTDWVSSGNIGRSYPDGDNQFAYYPAHGVTGWAGEFVYLGTHGRYWSSTPSSIVSSYFMNFQSTGSPAIFGINRIYGMPIRPVQHDE